jgi:hypothetical protein
MCVQRSERLSYVLQSASADPPVYLTWLIRPGPGGCTIRLQIDEIDTADSLQDAEDIWLPVLEALQQLVNPGRLPEVRPDGAPRGDSGVCGCRRGLPRCKLDIL